MARRAFALGVLALVGVLAVATSSSAHPFSSSSLKVHVGPERTRVFMALDGLTLVAVMIDQLGGDRGKVTPETLSAARDSILSYVDTKLELRANGRPCEPVELRGFAVLERGKRIRVLRDYSCPEPPRKMSITNDVFMEDEGGHKHLAFFHVGQQVVQHTFTREAKTYELDSRAALDGAGEAPDWDSLSGDVEPAAAKGGSKSPSSKATGKGFWAYFGEFLWQGVVHILIGIDHVLFVVALLVVVRTFKELAIVITSFTLAHSITLALGALELVLVSSRLVESLIALSIVYVGVENILREKPRSRHVVTFCFGLMHGFGFSSVLRDLGLGAGEGLVPSLLAFNLGVEAGQLLIVAPVYPVLRWLRTRNADRYRRLANAVSGVVAALAVVWFIERAFELKILPGS